MCCIVDFFIKYVFISSNIMFSIAGIAIAGLGIAAHIQLKQITDLIPVNLSGLSIGITMLGFLVFIIAYLACCGAIRQSMCMLIAYSTFMLILAAFKIYVTVAVFNFLGTANITVGGWISNAFHDADLRIEYNVMEELFRCCGTTGASSYPEEVPNTCCGNPVNVPCDRTDSYEGCFEVVSAWFERFGRSLVAVMIIIITVELVCVIFGLRVTNNISKNRRKLSREEELPPFLS